MEVSFCCSVSRIIVWLLIRLSLRGTVPVIPIPASLVYNTEEVGHKVEVSSHVLLR
jgi:hypothetical protein